MGYDFDEGYVALLAQTLHAQGLFVTDDIDHVYLELIPFESFGLELIDVQVLNMIKLGNDEIANQLIIDVQVRQRLPKIEKMQKSCQWAFSI